MRCGAILVFVAGFCAPAARAATFVSYDGSFSLQASDLWSQTPKDRFQSATIALVLERRDTITNKQGLTVSPAEISIGDITTTPLGSIPLATAAQRVLSNLKKALPKSRFTEARSVRLPKGLLGYGFGSRFDDRGSDTYIVELGRKRYLVTCKGFVGVETSANWKNWESECYSALGTLKAL